MTRYVIPLAGEPETFSVPLGGVEYRLTVRWCEAAEGGWLLDLALGRDAAEGAPLVAGVPLVTGADLLAPYGYLGVGGMLWCQSADETAPGAAGLGTEVQMIFETEDP